MKFRWADMLHFWPNGMFTCLQKQLCVQVKSEPACNLVSPFWSFYRCQTGQGEQMEESQKWIPPSPMLWTILKMELPSAPSIVWYDWTVENIIHSLTQPNTHFTATFQPLCCFYTKRELYIHAFKFDLFFFFLFACCTSTLQYTVPSTVQSV